MALCIIHKYVYLVSIVLDRNGFFKNINISVSKLQKMHIKEEKCAPVMLRNLPLKGAIVNF